jgi:hypothetical protein
MPGSMSQGMWAQAKIKTVDPYFQKSWRFPAVCDVIIKKIDNILSWNHDNEIMIAWQPYNECMITIPWLHDNYIMIAF